MTAISVTSVNVLDNPSKATNPLQFEIQYECMFDLADGERTAAPAGPAALGVVAFVPPRPNCHARACVPGSNGAPRWGSIIVAFLASSRRCLFLLPAFKRAAVVIRVPLLLRFPLLPDLEWKLTYVGSAESEKYDQVLDTVFVGPVAPGQYRFVFQVRFDGTRAP